MERVLARHEWQPRADAHRARVDDFTAGHRERARRGQTHPVWDFLFSYYSLRPRQLRVWHPGFGIALSVAGGYLERHGYVEVDQGVTVDPDYLRARAQTVRFIAGLLGSTASRPPRFSCFGMHEWAMVYRTDEVRHTGLPLRLGAAGTNAVLESMPLRCSHFDAYRFFTPAAAGRNTERLTRAGQAGSEQPGCLHTN
ncbi:MAG: 3-methyladenine DNA glycosylase, partial [Mycobacterium sp.]